VGAVLAGAGFETYFVGGCVRDLLLGLPVHDADLATAAHPEQVEAACAAAGLKTIPVGRSFGVVVAVAPSGHNVEVATFRSDSAYIDGRRPTAVSYSDARTDAERRDFTVNALLLDLRGGRVIDHVGGLDDLAARRLRAVGDAAARLAEDRLRVLRGLRFAAHLGLAIAPATWEAMRATGLAGLSAERLMQEWDKALASRSPGRWLELLAASGRLAELCPPLVGRDLAGTVAALGRFVPADGAALRAAVCLAAAEPAVVRPWLESQPLPSERIRAITWLLATDPLRLAAAPASLRWRTLRAGWPDELVRFTACRDPGHRCLPELTAWARDPRATRAWKPLLAAGDLIGLGFAPGPALGRALAALEDRELDGAIADRAEALRQAALLRHPAL
jgi:poly(A) polymerase